MRSKIHPTLFLLVTVVLGIALFVSRVMRFESRNKNLSPIHMRETTPNPKVQADRFDSTPLPNSNSMPAIIDSTTSQEAQSNHAEFVRSRVSELMTLAMNNDHLSLSTICSELSNPDHDIRSGALAAVVQFGDRSVVPRLRTLASETEETSEKAAIMAAADHLALPTIMPAHHSQRKIETQ